MPVSYWWECDDCHQKRDFYETVGTGIVRFLWRQIIAKQNQEPLRCGSCAQQALRLTFEFGQSIRRKSQQPQRSPSGVSSPLIKGEIEGCEDVYFDGEVRGTIRFASGRVTVGPHAKILADVTASEIVVKGKLDGALHACERVEVGRTGEVRGDISTGRIVVEEGGEVHGKVETARKKESGIGRVTEKASTADTSHPDAITATAGAIKVLPRHEISEKLATSQLQSSSGI